LSSSWFRLKRTCGDCAETSGGASIVHVVASRQTAARENDRSIRRLSWEIGNSPPRIILEARVIVAFWIARGRSTVCTFRGPCANLSVGARVVSAAFRG
jgi:hypothetical protein